MSEIAFSSKKSKEKDIIRLMITIYCRGKKHSIHGVCKSCYQLIKYSEGRIDNCPHTETKTFCSACKTHCYAPEERARIKEVMKYSGPRMLFYHPLMLVKHIIKG